MFTLLLIAGIGIGHLATESTAAYVKTGECTVNFKDQSKALYKINVLIKIFCMQEDQVCQYSYTVDQQHGDDTSNNIIASASVDVICLSGETPIATFFWQS